MTPDTAISAIADRLCVVPGWVFTAHDHTDRYADTIRVTVEIPDAPDTSGTNAPDYREPSTLPIVSHWALYLGDLDDDDLDSLLGRLVDIAAEVFQHETRETARVRQADGSWLAPFHPHRHDSIMTWSERTGRPIEADYRYGLA